MIKKAFNYPNPNNTLFNWYLYEFYVLQLFWDTVINTSLIHIISSQICILLFGQKKNNIFGQFGPLNKTMFFSFLLEYELPIVLYCITQV